MKSFAAGLLVAVVASSASASIMDTLRSILPKQVASVAEWSVEFVRKARHAFDERPANHPFECDFRDALGLPKDLKFNRKDVEKHGRLAAKWWHSDRGGTDEAFQAFNEIKAYFVGKHTNSHDLDT